MHDCLGMLQPSALHKIAHLPLPLPNTVESQALSPISALSLLPRAPWKVRGRWALGESLLGSFADQPWLQGKPGLPSPNPLCSYWAKISLPHVWGSHPQALHHQACTGFLVHFLSLPP